MFYFDSGGNTVPVRMTAGGANYGTFGFQPAQGAGGMLREDPVESPVACIPPTGPNLVNLGQEVSLMMAQRGGNPAGNTQSGVHVHPTHGETHDYHRVSEPTAVGPAGPAGSCPETAAGMKNCLATALPLHFASSKDLSSNELLHASPPLGISPISRKKENLAGDPQQDPPTKIDTGRRNSKKPRRRPPQDFGCHFHH